MAVVATALPLTFQITNMAGWVARSITGIFENLGQVQDGMRSIAVPQQMPDAPDARPLRLAGGGIRFERVAFGYGTERGVLHGIDLDVRPGERIGLVGRSGAGKSTLVNLLLGFYRPDAGRIAIDGQDIAGVTQESLRAQIAMVTQDTSLLHRSIRDNIRYGRTGASDAAVEAAARRAEAHEFILGLEDWRGRTGVRRRSRRARGQAVGRPAAADRDRAGDPEGCADPGAGRGHVGAGQRGGGGDPESARRIDGGPDGDRDRAPAVNDRADGTGW